MENPYAGQGPVLLDIGGDTGALVVAMPPELEGKEVEIRPVDHRPDPGPLRHVAVLGRTVTGRTQHSAVFPDLQAGQYELYLRPDGAERLRASVIGGQVCYAVWPGATN
ncbi:hypothetical protein [Kribbella sp. NPDC004536]|uniref:hypothetical protein n=1 Tax=Kribbella sp. NPDC004536 TaxID=3364106 RepID=UPI0036A63F07